MYTFAYKKIAPLRKEKKLTQKGLAELVMVSVPTMNKIENGLSVPRVDKLIDIASVLNINPLVFFAFESEPLEVRTVGEPEPVVGIEVDPYE
jgi:transcriptional regulator with XRE-family HTH domain